MVLALVVGDLHVPERAAGIPAAFRKMLTPGRIQMVFITGNVGCRDMYDYFRTLAPEVYCARGECDGDWAKSLPDTLVVEVEGLKIGLIHGHQIIPTGDRDSQAIVQRQLDVDVLLSGATHVTKVSEFGTHLFINPGSITGAMSPVEYTVVPSFVLLDIRDTSITAFTYRYLPDQDDDDAAGDGDVAKPSQELDDDASVKIRKKEWVKE